MATYGGLIAEFIVQGERESTQLPGFVVGENLMGPRQRLVTPAVIVRPFYWDDNIDASVHGKRSHLDVDGMMTWGDGLLPPRRYPLELSWRSPIRQQ